MWAFAIKLFGWLSGLDLGTILGKAADAYKAKLDSGDTQAKIAADLAAKKVELDVREADINASVVKAEQGNWLTRMARPMIAIPFVAFLWKAILWDKVVMGSWLPGRTDDLGAQLNAVLALILGSYFGGRTIEKLIGKYRGTGD